METEVRNSPLGTSSPDRAAAPGDEKLFDLEGGYAITEFIFGIADVRHRRKFYHLAKTSPIPVFKVGSKWCARSETLRQWVVEHEQKRRTRSK